MPSTLSIDLPMPAGLSRFKLPKAVQARLTKLLDQQDAGIALTAADRREAEGLVEMTEFLSLLKLRAKPSKRRAA